MTRKSKPINVEKFIEEKANSKKNNDFVLTASEIHSKPLTFDQLRRRLKHIATLCWGLSIDLQNEIDLRKSLEAERENFELKIKELKEEIRLLQMRLCSNTRYSKRVAEQYDNKAGNQDDGET